MRKRILRPPPPREWDPPRKRGGQPGNHNRLKHGRRRRRWLALRAAVSAHVRDTYALLEELGFFHSRRRVDMPEKAAIKTAVNCFQADPLHSSVIPEAAQRLSGTYGEASAEFEAGPGSRGAFALLGRDDKRAERD